jgi:ABC-type sugar transport system substrate-binding protein
MVDKMKGYAVWGAVVGSIALTLSPITQSAAFASVNSLAGKKVLFVPYWLDDFGTATSSWVTRDFKAAGITVVTENPNAVTSAQLTTLETAVANHTYAGIIWQPVDKDTALTMIQKIEAAKIPQVVMGANVPETTVHFSESPVGYSTDYLQAGEMAATYIKAHPELGPPTIAYQDVYPETGDTLLQFQSLVNGVRKVSPGAKVVYDQGANSQAQADTQMTNFLERHVKFNIFGGSGTALSMGGIQAIDGAGLGGAVPGSHGSLNKMPQHVYMVAAEGAPEELALLWSPKSSLMASPTLSPKNSAENDFQLIMNELTGKTAYNQKAVVPIGYSTIGTNCSLERPLEVATYAGVKGFTIPQCPR